MRKFHEVRIFDHDDLEFNGDAYLVSLIDDNTGVTIMEGDWYHDKIDSKIEGFYACLDYLGIDYEVGDTVNKNDVDRIYG